MLLDQDIVAVSPSSTWRVLGKAGLLQQVEPTSAYGQISPKGDNTAPRNPFMQTAGMSISNRGGTISPNRRKG